MIRSDSMTALSANVDPRSRWQSGFVSIVDGREVGCQITGAVTAIDNKRGSFHAISNGFTGTVTFEWEIFIG